MKKIMQLGLVGVFVLFAMSGCSSKKEEFSKVIDSAFIANQELVDQYDWDDYYSLYQRDQSHIMMWDDENNYYVYLRKNIDNAYVRGDGYKIGKTNDEWDSSPSDRAKIKDFLDDNVPPIYEEKNINLVSDDEDMR